MDNAYSLRPVCQADIDLLYEWANDPLVRAQSFSVDPISRATHQAWFTSMLAAADVQLWIYCVNDVPAGQVRGKYNSENELLISYSICAEFRGKGHGKRMIDMVTGAARERFPQVTRLIALVKPENLRSKHVFESNGYCEDYICYSKPCKECNP